MFGYLLLMTVAFTELCLLCTLLLLHLLFSPNICKQFVCSKWKLNHLHINFRGASTYTYARRGIWFS